MSDPVNPEPFSEDERRLLAAWDVPSPSGASVDAVLERIAREPQEPELVPLAPRSDGFRRREWGLLALAAAAVLALGATWWSQPNGHDRSGHVDAVARTSAVVGSRGRLVAEAGARLSWREDDDGALWVQQEAGSVLYATSGDGPTVVTTPMATLSLAGRGAVHMEILDNQEDGMRNSRWNRALGLIGAGALGSAVTTIMLVTVYEGEVKGHPVGAATAPGDAVVLQPGESAVLTNSDVHRLEPGEAAALPVDRPGAPLDASERVPSAEAPAGSAVTNPTDRRSAPADSAALCQSQNKDLANLKEQLRETKKSLEKARMQSEDGDYFDHSQEARDVLADECRLRYDHPHLSVDGPSKMGDDLARELNLTPAERKAVDESVAASHNAILDHVRAMYAEATGEEASANVSPRALLAEIHHQTEETEAKQVLQRVSAHLAGRQVQIPQDPTPLERLYQRLVVAGDELESVMAKRLGPEMARAIRKHRGGYSQKTGIGRGCP